MNANKPIGIFDSGVGGLTVAKAIHEILPNEELLYVGDTQHMPYGDKSAEHIQQYCKNIVDFFLQQDVKLIVIACNTASAIASSYLRKLYWEKVEIKGVIRPVVKIIVERKFKQVGIIGTQGTIGSGIFPKIYKEYGGDGELHLLATPLLAPMIEQGDINNEMSDAIIKNYLCNDEFKPCDAIVLACTHYPLIKQQVDTHFSFQKEIIDNASPMAETVLQFLNENKLHSTNTKPVSKFFVTEYTKNFEQIASMFYGDAITISEINVHNT